MVSRAPGSPISTGHTPTLTQADAAAASSAGGSVRRSSSPPAIVSAAWADPSDRARRQRQVRCFETRGVADEQCELV